MPATASFLMATASSYSRVLKGGGGSRGVCNPRFPNTPYYTLSFPKNSIIRQLARPKKAAAPLYLFRVYYYVLKNPPPSERTRSSLSGRCKDNYLSFAGAEARSLGVQDAK